MAKDDFLINLRNAYRELFGRSHGEHPLLDPEGTARLLRRTSRWLSAKSVEGYSEADFADLSQERRHELTEAVHAFANIARSVSPESPATEAQFIAGRDALKQIGSIVGESERSAWLHAIDRLLIDSELWARAQEWETKRDSKHLTDSFFGRYEVPVLLIHSPQGRLLVDPIARYVVGGSGVVDLCVMPSFESARIISDGKVWSVQTDFDDRAVRPLTQTSFVDTAKALLQRA